MKSTELYAALEQEFIKRHLSEYDWESNVTTIADLLSENFKKRYMGVLVDFADDIAQVYTAVFPSVRVFKALLDQGTHDALLFVHHPAVWDIRGNPDADAFVQINRGLLLQCKKQRIALYCLHVPLDNYGPYSTSVTLAQAVDITPTKPFAHYFGAYAGVFGSGDYATVEQVQQRFVQAVGHEVRLYAYGDTALSGTIAVVAGGGLMLEVVQEIIAAGCNTLVTGLTLCNAFTQPAHDYARQNGLNILGGTHYSTEKFACIALCDYFKKLALPAQFIADEPQLQDL